MITLRRITISFVLLCGYIANAQSTSFEPAEGYFSSYDFSHEYRTKVRDILLKGITDKPDAMLVTLGSFDPERAIVITGDEVILLNCSERIWANDAPENIKVEKKSFRISKELAEAVHNLWFDALGTTAYPNDSHPTGASYYFTTFRVNIGLRAGMARAPEPKSLPSELRRIANELHYLGEGIAVSEKKLLAEVKALHSKTTERLQYSTDKTTTAPESKPKGEENPKLESETRPK